MSAGRCTRCAQPFDAGARYCIACGAALAAVGAVCSQHPDRAATETCARCGSFICAECRGKGGWCPACLARGDPEDAARAQRLRRELVWVSLGGAGILVLLVVWNLIYGKPDSPSNLVLGGGAIGMPMVVTALVVGFTRSRAMLWVAVGFEALVLLPLSVWAAIGVNPCMLGLIVPVHALVRGVQLHRLLGRLGTPPWQASALG